MLRLEWEEIGDSGLEWRAPILGGWLVKVLENRVHETDQGKIGGWDFFVALAFVPDPNHEWGTGKRDTIQEGGHKDGQD